jgi:hypothetical protein
MNKKALIYSLGGLFLLAIIYFFFFKKGRKVVEDKIGRIIPISVNNGTSKQMTPAEVWRSKVGQEFTKEVFFEEKLFRAQVKNYDNTDFALLADNRVLFWSNKENKWKLFN